MFARSPPACQRNGTKRAASAGRLSPTTPPVVSFLAAAERSVQVQSFVGSATLAAMNALMESWSSASSVGDDDHPDIRMSPESAAAVGLAPVLALALGVVAPGLPHATTRIAMSDKTASADFFIGFLLPVRARVAYRSSVDAD